METTPSKADKGIKTVGIFSLISIGIVNFNHQYIKWWLLLVGFGYLYFALQKLQIDKQEGNNTQKAWFYSIAGAFACIVAIVLFIADVI